MNFKRIILLALISSTLVNAQSQQMRKEMPFEKYNFIRDSYSSQNFEFQMGNAEMGGLAEKKGLGFEKLWFTDVWANKEWRKSLPGPILVNAEFEKRDYTKAKFHHELNIKYGITSTSVAFNDGRGYETKIFFSKKNKHLLVFNLKNISKQASDSWKITVPASELNVIQSDTNRIDATMKVDTFYTKVAWSVKSSKAIRYDGKNIIFKLNPDESITLLYSVATHWDGGDFNSQVQNAVNQNQSFAQLEDEQRNEWNKQWSSIASIILPEGEYAKWFYRCISALYATSGAEKFTAGEEMFSIPDPDWHMHAFTYGHGGGWSVWAFALLGDRGRAMNVANWLYKPNALKENVKILFPKLGPVELVYRDQSKGIHTYLTSYNPNALAFGHELNTEGYNITYKTTKHWDLQRHIDGYAGAFYHLLNRYFPNKDFNDKVAYPVLKGTAEFYSELVKWDSTNSFYYLPPLLSVSENIMEKSVLDAVLSVRWDLNMASNYAKRMGVDDTLSKKWKTIASNIYIPHNDTTYLEYLGDSMLRKGGGYFGIRAFQYLGYPYLEQIKDIDITKARKSLDRAWKANNEGKGMISFIANWFALNETYLGFGQKAYDKSKTVLVNEDPSGACLCEVISTNDDGTKDCINKYFLTGYDSFILVPISMILQSYNGEIKLFPAMPKEFSDVEFYDLPAEAGVKVSSVYQNGKIKWIKFRKGNTAKLIMNNIKDTYKINEL